jgi:uncharacterized protein YciI
MHRTGWHDTVMLRVLALACGVLLFHSCNTKPAQPVSREYTFVWIKTGTRTAPLPPAEREEVFRGHFANMAKLSRAGHLLLAGPYGKERSDASLRGIFMLDTADPATARQLAETDPGFLAGEFRFDYAKFTTTAALAAQRLADLAAHDAIVATGRTPAPGEGGRGYVWLTAANEGAAAAALTGMTQVLLFASTSDGRAIVLLDAATKADAERLVAPLATPLGNHVLDEWYGSGLLTALPTRAVTTSCWR